VRYRHTQPGWVIVLVVGLAVLLVMVALPKEAAGVASVPLVLLGLALLLFSALTVEVDQESIRVWFGPGLVRKRIPLAQVEGWRAVRNPWYSGWGIRAGPGGMLWNVSGFDAIELDLPGGRRFRIGTDEPEALMTAITQAKGVSAPQASPADAGVLERRTTAWGGPAIAVGLVVAGLLVVGGLMWRQAQPVDVRVGPDGIEIGTPLYGTTLPATEIAAIVLEPGLPRILTRTNGFAAAGVLRGHFRLEGLGDGRLYVDVHHPPYLLVRLREGYVFLNFPEPDRTRAIYEEAARRWPDRAAYFGR
jgi:hypothetical protein